MTNKWIPKYKCPKCNKIVWDFDENISSFKCRYCQNIIEKKLHDLDGAMINKEGSNYVLEFSEYKEKSIYSNWETLSKELNRLGENDKI